MERSGGSERECHFSEVVKAISLPILHLSKNETYFKKKFKKSIGSGGELIFIE